MANDNTGVATSELPDIPKPANLSREPKEKGATGTLNFGGIITGEEYNPKLVPPQCWDVYEEMRRSDAQVQASLEICKAPLSSATWKVQAPPNATPQEQEVADFCQRALFDKGAMADPWDYVLDHALLQLDFGVTVFEKVWILGQDQRIRLHRLAPRLPKTIWKWNPADNGQLASLEQFVIKGGAYQYITIDAADLLVSTRKQEGDNYWGISVLRSAYKDWFYKKQAEMADATRIYRYGVGTPIASRAKDYSYSEGEEEAVTKTLKLLSSHERSYIQTHDGITWKILVPEGGHGGAVGILEKIQRHDRVIIRNVLADFMSDTADGLNSGRTRTLADIFTSCLYTISGRIAGMFDLSVIRPLCLYNFPMTGLRFPTLEASDVTDVDVKMLADVLTRLGVSKYVTPDDDLESFLRVLLGIPPLPENLRGKSREKAVVPPPGAPPAPADPNNPAPPKDPNPDDPASAKDPVKARALLLKRKPAVEYEGRLYARQPNAFELTTFSLAAVPDMLDRESGKLVDDLIAIRKEQLKKLAAQIAKKDGRDTAAFTDLRPDEFTVPLKQDVIKTIKTAILRVASFGAIEVRQELLRQGLPLELRTPIDLPIENDLDDLVITTSFGTLRLAKTPAENKTTTKSALTTSAKMAGERETDAWFNSILETGIRLRNRGLEGDQLELAINDAFSSTIDVGLKSLAKGATNDAFSLGRAAEAAQHKDEIKEVEYSCLLDANSCEPCAKLDGETFPFGSDRYFQTLPPYKDCQGNKGRPDACRCVHLFKIK